MLTKDYHRTKKIKIHSSAIGDSQCDRLKLSNSGSARYAYNITKTKGGSTNTRSTQCPTTVYYGENVNLFRHKTDNRSIFSVVV